MSSDKVTGFFRSSWLASFGKKSCYKHASSLMYHGHHITCNDMHDILNELSACVPSVSSVVYRLSRWALCQHRVIQNYWRISLLKYIAVTICVCISLWFWQILLQPHWTILYDYCNLLVCMNTFKNLTSPLTNDLRLHSMMILLSKRIWILVHVLEGD